ncbi:MAG: LysR family transcriptional regulator [Phycisphaerae bacterium]
MPRVQPGPRKGRSTPKRDAPPGAWEGRLRLWIVIDGLNALGPGKVRLLDLINTTKSLSAAAKRLRMSYRAAWEHLRFIEERTGITVVEARRGGRAGGGTVLTPEGKTLLQAFHDFHREVEQHADSAFHRHFAPWTL